MASSSTKIAVVDEIDRDILGLLERDGRATFMELARAVGLSPNAVAERVRRLVAGGIVTGFSAQLDPEALGLNVHAFVDVKLAPSMAADAFETALSALPSAIGWTLTTGRFDYTIRVACADHAALVDFIEHIRSKAGAVETYSRVILRETRSPLIPPARRRR